VNSTLFIISTIKTIENLYGTIFKVIEGITIFVFTIEYILRVYVCIERKSLREKGWFW
jgi:hypothetical protein